MSFGALFTLRTRARQAKPAAKDEAWPDVAGYVERRAKDAPPREGSPRRRAGDRSQSREGGR